MDSELKRIEKYLRWAAITAALSIVVDFFIWPGMFFVVVDIWVFGQSYKMYKAAKAGDIAKLKYLNSVWLIVMAFIFGWAIPGIFLLLAHGPIATLEGKGGGEKS